MRVFIGLTEVSGFYYHLKKGFDKVGIPAEYASVYGHPFQYAEDVKPHFLVTFSRYCVARRIHAGDGLFFLKWFWLGMLLFSRILLFGWAVAKFDVFLLGGGSSFFQFAEFPLLKLFGKKIIYTFHGTDCRPAYIDGIFENLNWHIGGDLSADSLIGNDKQKPGLNPDVVTRYHIDTTSRRRRNVANIDKYADVIVNVPPQAHFHTRPYVHGLIVGLPFQFLPSVATSVDSCATNLVQILHCPSHRGGKGTNIIREAISNLRHKGYEIEYVEISGKPNKYVLEEIRKCDFVVDQVYSDNPMAGFASEAAFLGKPAVVAGYYSRLVKDDLPAHYIPPTLYCHPDEIEQAIERMLVDKNLRVSLGARAKQYVEERWTADKVALRYLRLIEGDIPKDWIYDPCSVQYLHGAGLSEQQARCNVRSVLEMGGKEALQLGDKPLLEKMFIDFAYQSAERC